MKWNQATRRRRESKSPSSALRQWFRTPSGRSCTSRAGRREISVVHPVGFSSLASSCVRSPQVNLGAENYSFPPFTLLGTVGSCVAGFAVRSQIFSSGRRRTWSFLPHFWVQTGGVSHSSLFCSKVELQSSAGRRDFGLSAKHHCAISSGWL